MSAHRRKAEVTHLERDLRLVTPSGHQQTGLVSNRRTSAAKAAMLAAQMSANPSSTHLKSELIITLTAAIQPIETTPATIAPASAKVLRWRKAVMARVSVSTPVAIT